MSSAKERMRFVSTDTFMDLKKTRKKKSKKVKKDKLDRNKLKRKNEQWLKHYTDCCESSIYTQSPETKKKKKKKTEVSLNEEFPFPLTQCKESKPYKKRKSFRGETDTHRIVGIVHPGPAELDATFAEPNKNLTRTNKTQTKKRVTFTLSPLIRQPITRDLQTHSGPAKLPSPNTVFPANRLPNKPHVDENFSQTPSEDVNSQDLFITQKSFSDPYTDTCSSASVDEPEALPAQQSHRPLSQHRRPCKHSFEASTQTENFFTSPMPASSLRFYGPAVCTEQPLDLSIPERSRALHARLTVTDLTSSDESDTTAKSKSELSQLKVVQTRLNESFFFKLKGDVDSPKPRSPLMKFTSSVDKKKP